MAFRLLDTNIVSFMMKSHPLAATALAFDLELVTHNPADFVNIPGLVVITEAP